MRNTMKYIVDDQGVKTSIIVPYDKWKKINADYKKLQNKFEVFMAIQDGLSELQTTKTESKKLQTLSDYLNESNS